MRRRHIGFAVLALACAWAEIAAHAQVSAGARVATVRHTLNGAGIAMLDPRVAHRNSQATPQLREPLHRYLVGHAWYNGRHYLDEFAPLLFK